MNAAHAYHVEATLPALLCSFENFSGFQITRISMSLLFTKMSLVCFTGILDYKITRKNFINKLFFPLFEII